MSAQKKIFALCCALLLFLSGAPVSGRSESAAAPEDCVLNVALFPYVPDPGRFEEVCREQWAEHHPEVRLNFVSWDCYHDEIPADLDVFVFDSMFLTGYAEQGLLLPIPEGALQNAEDFLPFALEGSRVDGTLFAVPQLLCTNLLFTRKEDAALSCVSDIPGLYAVLGDRVLESEIPEAGEGLLIDMSGGFSKLLMYLDALCDVAGAYSDYAETPDPAFFSPEAVASLRLLCDMGGVNQVQYEPENWEPYVRARWFAEGRGRALIAYTEAMSAMGDYAEKVNFRPFSYASTPNIQIYSGDLAGIRASIEEEKKEPALDLVQLLTGAGYLTAACAANENQAVPSFLLPARISSYMALSASSPIYEDLLIIAMMPGNQLFRAGADAMEYAATARKILPDLVFAQPAESGQ